MRDLGTVLSVSASGNLTVRATGAEFPTEGSAVRDARGIVRGRVVRVFGPVARPYFSVRLRRVPSPAEGLALVGNTVVRD